MKCLFEIPVAITGNGVNVSMNDAHLWLQPILFYDFAFRREGTARTPQSPLRQLKFSLGYQAARTI
jgi:hypothetical protein